MPKKDIFVSKREQHQQIQHIRISLGNKFHLKQNILFFLDKIYRNGKKNFLLHFRDHE